MNSNSSLGDSDPNKKRLKSDQTASLNNNKPPYSSPASSPFMSGNKMGGPNHQHAHSSHHQTSGGGTGHHYYHQPQNESKFYSLTSIEVKDPLEISLEEAFNKLQHLISPAQFNQADSTLFNELSQYANQSKAHSDEVLSALLYSILTDPANSIKSLRNLFLCNNLSFNFGAAAAVGGNQQPDSASSYATLVNHLVTIITEFYPKLLDTTRKQLLWLLKELTKARVSQFEKLILQLLRNIQTGCLTEKNVWLAESMLDILYDRALSMPSGNGSNNGADQPNVGNLWFFAHNELMTQSVYSYLRIIADHAQAPHLSALRQKETDFCIHVLR
jgi:integrator complex subunit 3